ncbi:MAG TPA: methionyl-tRNA formyltransferase [Rhodocyclaceae bacterium]
MKIVFAGTPVFAVPSLRALVDAGHEVSLVLTQPDRPAGRGLRLQASPVKEAAQAFDLPILQPPTLKDAAIQARLAEEKADAMVVVAYGLILPKVVLDQPRHGCLNVHASLLPRWRGAAPIQRALLAGDSETGVSIMAMDAGLDTGAVYRRRHLPISASDTAATLHDRLASLGAEALIETLANLNAGTATAQAQPVAGVTYAAKIDKAEAQLDWQRSAIEIGRSIRAFDPFPGALTRLDGAPCKIWAARPIDLVDARAAPGEVLAVDGEGITVACGSGRLLLTSLQRAGGRRLATKDFIAGYPLPVGARFG